MTRKRYQNIGRSTIVVGNQRYGRGESFVAAYEPGAEKALVDAGTLTVLEVIDPIDPPVPAPRSTKSAPAPAPDRPAVAPMSAGAATEAPTQDATGKAGRGARDKGSK